LDRIGPRKRNRLENFDYSENNIYFVTICTKNKMDWLGEVDNGCMKLNGFGLIAEKQWIWINEQYTYIELDEFIIMPNHLHGMIAITNKVGTSRDLSNQNINPNRFVGTGFDLSIKIRKIKSLPEIIGAFKTTSSKSIHESGLNEFAWQRSYYDHIIRDEKSLNSIREYIHNNPLKWELDKDGVENIFVSDW